MLSDERRAELLRKNDEHAAKHGIPSTETIKQFMKEHGVELTETEEITPELFLEAYTAYSKILFGDKK